MSDKGLVPQSRIDGLEDTIAELQEEIGSIHISITGAASTIVDDNLTKNRAVISNGSGKIAVSSTSSTELGYLHGVTSAVQTQLDSKQNAITGAASSVIDSDLSANKVLVSDSSGKISESTVNTSDLNNISGSTGNIQQQINSLNETSNLHEERISDLEGTSNLHEERISDLEGTSTSLQTQIDNKMKLINGSEGEVLYFNKTNEGFTQTIMNEGYCCLTEEDVEICKNHSPSFSEVFNSWNPFLKSSRYYNSFGIIDEENLDDAWNYGAQHSGLDPEIFENCTVVGSKNCATTVYRLNKIPSTPEAEYTPPEYFEAGDLFIINSNNINYDRPKYAIYDGTSWSETDITTGPVRGAKDCSATVYDLTKIPEGTYEAGNLYKINSTNDNELYAIWTGTEWVELEPICNDVLVYKKDINAWEYDETNDTIKMPRNTAAATGFISPKKYSNYDITVRLYSSSTGDDDVIGLVACCAYDSNGLLHTLSFIRTPGNNASKGSNTYVRWACILDYGVQTISPNNERFKQWKIADKSLEAQSPYDLGITSKFDMWGYPSIGVGTVINMSRDGNVITAACSQFNSTEIDENTRLTIDLDEMSQTYPILNVFKGSSSWGYTTFSQAQSMYENIQIITSDLYIYDIPNNQVLYFDKNDRTWKPDETKDPYGEIGTGRLSFNTITKKLFYNGGKYITELGNVNDTINKSEMVPAHVITETYQNGTDWYRIWSDGWIEQGGIITNTTSGGSEINTTKELLKEMSDTNYTILANPFRNDDFVSLEGFYSAVTTYATTTTIKFKATGFNSNQFIDGIKWYVCGYGA